MTTIKSYLNILSCLACDDGFYGDCLQTCGICLNSDCYKTDGHCAEGCKSGYRGELCSTGNVLTFEHIRHFKTRVLF